MKIYNYLIKRKTDGELFYAHGNKHDQAIGLSCLFEIVDPKEINEGCAIPVKFGRYVSKTIWHRNVSTDNKFNGKEYDIIYQTRCI